jgi:hypothetical protein
MLNLEGLFGKFWNIFGLILHFLLQKSIVKAVKNQVKEFEGRQKASKIDRNAQKIKGQRW